MGKALRERRHMQRMTLKGFCACLLAGVELEDGGGKGDRSTMFADKGIKRILPCLSGHFHGTLNPWHQFK